MRDFIKRFKLFLIFCLYIKYVIYKYGFYNYYFVERLFNEWFCSVYMIVFFYLIYFKYDMRKKSIVKLV